MIPLPIEKWLAIVGGARRDAVQEAPQALGSAAMVGLLSLASCAAAAFTAAYALANVFQGPAALALAVGGGLLWEGGRVGVDLSAESQHGQIYPASESPGGVWGSAVSRARWHAEWASAVHTCSLLALSIYKSLSPILV